MSSREAAQESEQMNIDGRQLGVLLDVVRTGSFSAAARLRNTSQPAISQAIALLEGQLGSLVLERTRNGIRPTVTGQILVRRALAIEEQLKAAQEEVRLNASGIDGPLTIAGPPGALVSLVPLALNHLFSTKSEISLRIRECADSELIDMLRSGQIDLALTTTGIETLPEDINEIDILTDRFELVVGKDNTLIGDQVSLKDLESFPWVLPYQGGAFSRHLDAMFTAAQVKMPSHVVRCDSLATTKEIIRTTYYISILPNRIVAPEVDAGLLRTLRITDFPMQRKVGVRMLMKSHSAPLALAFLSSLKEASKAL